MPKSSTRMEPASVEFYEGGSLARVQREKIKGGPRGGERGVIQTFSRASRRRLMRFIATLQRDAQALFVTLTYPDHFPEDHNRWKRDLKVFAARLKREYPRSAFVWRIELKSRKSGENKGGVAPHYHLLLYGVVTSSNEELSRFRTWLSKTWYEVVNSNDERHLKAGTSCEFMESHRGVMAYASKYLGKVEQTARGAVGRHWGAYFRSELPLAEPIRVELTDKQAVKVIRLFRRFARVPSRAYSSLTIFLDASHWRQNIERMVEEEGT